MVDPVATPLVNVGLALTSMLLNATQQQQAAAIVTDARDPIILLTQAILGRRGTKKDIERTIHKDLTLRMREMSERCHRDGINSDRLASPCAEVEEILNAIDDHEQLLEQAVHDPNAVRAFFEQQAQNSRIQVDERLVPYFDELIKAVTELYITYAERSSNYQQLALKQLLKSDRENRETWAQMHETIADVPHKVAELVSSESKPSRVFFGSRPDVVAEDRFVPRGEQEQLNALITDPTRRRTVLVGMRGCGKTQLASTLAQQCEDAHWSLVAWVNASSTESITSDLVELAKELKKELKIDTSDQPTPKTIIHRLFNRLKSAAPSDRLIVFDNVENIDDLRGLLPSGKGLRIVATTTNNAGWEHHNWKTIKVGVFDRSESIDYLLTVTRCDDHDAADALAQRLGDLPLALAQAAATARHKDLSLARYLKRLESRRQEPTIHTVAGGDYTVDVATALLMAIKDTIEGLEGNTRETAQRQLGALALLAESGVPTRWLDPTIERLDDDESDDSKGNTDEDAHDALTELGCRCIVQQAIDGSTTVLHRLQAQVLRESWSERELKQAYESASALLGSVDLEDFPRNATDLLRRETRDLIEQLYALSTQDHSCLLLEKEEARTCLRRVFRFAHELGLSYEALTLQPVVEILQDLLSSVHPEILALRSSLASLYESAGDADEAIILHEHVLTDSICVLGEDHPVTLSARNSLASSYLSVGRLTKAITHFEQVLADNLRILGEDHPQTLIARINLAGAYDSAGRSDDAISLLEDVLSNSLRVFGEDHPYTLSARNNLASAYESAGQLSAAITHFEQVLADSLRILGEHHPQTLSTRNNLASAYESAGQLSAAITLQEQVLTDSIRVLGEDHPDTLIARNNLASAYESAGQLSAAITLQEQVLTDSIRVLGEDHPDTLIARNNLASAYESAGRTDEAITLYEQVLTDRRRVLGKDHPATLTSFHNLAGVYESVGRTDEAITLYEQVVTDRSRILGENHPQTLASRNNLAYTYLLMGRTDDAVSHIEQTLIRSTRALGEEHPLTVSARKNLEVALHVLKQRKDDVPTD